MKKTLLAASFDSEEICMDWILSTPKDLSKDKTLDHFREQLVKALSLDVKPGARCKLYRLDEIGEAKMEEGGTIAKMPDWMVLTGCGSRITTDV